MSGLGGMVNKNEGNWHWLSYKSLWLFLLTLKEMIAAVFFFKKGLLPPFHLIPYLVPWD